MTNPLLRDAELPLFPEIKPEHMVPAITQVIDEAVTGISRLLAEGPHTYGALIKGREALEDRLHRVWSPISHLSGVMNSPELREAHAACLELITAYYSQMGQHRGLFEAYEEIAASAEFSTLGHADRKVIENALRDFRLSGIDLPEAEQSRFSDLAMRMSSLSTTFSNNVLDATQAWKKQVVDIAELAGIPEDDVQRMQTRAEAEGEKGYLLTLDIPCYLAVMTYATSRSLREEVYKAFGTRASHLGPNAGEFDNTLVMEELLATRLESAQLLGFDNFAALSVETKMARSPEAVLDFLNNLADKSRPFAFRELAEIEAFAKNAGGPQALEAWDIAFYAEQLKKASFDISDEELRPYFPAPVVLEGMFEVTRRLFDTEIVQNDKMSVWHPDVLTFDVRRSSVTVARFYLDLYARQDKRGGAWMDDCRVRRIDESGNLQLPVAYLTCNFSGPVADKPALLTHDEVVTLFHEFGHGLHHMLTRVDAGPVSGINGVAWDAVELPSQFMENYCWQAESIALISGHFESGEPLPKEMLNRLLSARNFQAAMAMVRQLEFALFDFELHTAFDPASKDQVQRTIEGVRQRVAVVKPPAEYAFQHAFSHIFGGGYAAGYYSYKWAEVLSADAFSRFIEEGVFNRQTGENFLSEILEKGGSVDAMDLFVAFRGREPDVNALLRQDGIAA